MSTYYGISAAIYGCQSELWQSVECGSVGYICYAGANDRNWRRFISTASFDNDDDNDDVIFSARVTSPACRCSCCGRIARGSKLYTRWLENETCRNVTVVRNSIRLCARRNETETKQFRNRFFFVSVSCRRADSLMFAILSDDLRIRDSNIYTQKKLNFQCQTPSERTNARVRLFFVFFRWCSSLLDLFSI